jgi:L-arabinokinase
MKIRYYISGHGLGHASRSCQIINALRRRHPAIAVEVVSSAHPWFFAGFLDPSVPVRSLSLDLGVLQRDSLVMEEEATLRACRNFQPQRQLLVAAEAASLRTAGVSLVAADIPAPAFAAAAAAGVPSVAISNFSWDWIYAGLAERHPGYDDVVAAVGSDYAQADLLLRLPFYGDFPAFRRIEDMPLVARRARRPAAEVRRALGIAEGTRVGLISFGGFGLCDFDSAPLAHLDNWIFLTETGLGTAADNVRMIAADHYYPDLVAAADVVITKPGYGIVAEAIAGGTAVLYTPRGDFREQALLVAALHRYTRARKIGNDQLRRGEWSEALEMLLAQPQPEEKLPADGDIVAADRLALLCEE